MNQSRKIPSKKRIGSLEFTFNADLVKEVIFSCSVEDGEIDWGDGTVELRNNIKITDSENKFKHDYSSTSGIVTVHVAGTWIFEFSIRDIELIAFKVVGCKKMHGLYVINCNLQRLTFIRSTLLVLYCGCNKIRKLNLRKISNLIMLNCENNYIKSLDLTTNLSLCRVNCKFNLLNEIKLSELNTKIHYLRCSFNNLSKEVLSEIIDILLTRLGLIGFDMDYAFNPGTDQIDKSGFDKSFWNVNNIYYETMIPRLEEYTRDKARV
ncbi:hypothetical protein [Butyricimonas paravirosa]|uniref:hypothetical protein n=1 Tax=Butyricimonas paravirosa TaxID=1472417 RepID=UPI0022E04783|nr:hypothetical protein [Butyricimonas paravirosa]